MYRQEYTNLYSILNRYATEFKRNFPQFLGEEYIDNIITKISRITAPDEKFASFDAALLVMGYLWDRYKICYSVNEDFLTLLGDTEDITLNVDLLKRLPYNTFFIKTGKLGYLVYIETWDDAAGFFIAQIADAKQNGIRCVVKNLWIEDGSSLSKSVAQIVRKDHLIRQNSGMETHSEEEQVEIAKKMQDLFLKIVNFSLYLSAQNAVINPKKIQKKDRPVSVSGKRLNIKEWEVGYRIVTSPYGGMVADFDQEGTTRLPGGHASPRPHMRRAHWHHYWIGREGDKRLVLKWIEPVWVMGGSEKLIPTEVNI